MADAWRSYLELAYGLGKTSRKRADKAVRELVGKGNAKASELQQMVEDLMAAGGANRDAIVELIRTELDKALNRVGLVKAEEVAALRERVAELEAAVAAAPGGAGVVDGAVVSGAAAAPAAAKKAVAKKAAAAKASGVVPGAPAATGAKAAKAAPVAKKAVAKKAVAKKGTPAKKAAQ